jgi:type IV secretion system protein VirD4
MLRQASGKGRALERYLQDVIAMREESGEPFSVACVAALNRFLQSPEETSRNVLASFVAPLSLFGNPVVDKATSSDDFDLRDLRKRKMSVYVNIPAAEVAQAGFMLNVFFSVLINQNIKELPEDTPELRYVCLLMLDEFTAAGRIAPIAKGVGFMAGYNLRLAIVVQDKSQLEQEEAYGKAGAQSILANMGAVVSFAPRTEAESESLSKLIGFETLTVRQRQRSWGRGPRTHSENEVQHRRAVMLPQELRWMNSGKALVQRPGVAVILADNITYYDDQRFAALLSQVPHRIVNVAGTNRRVPVPTEAPPTGWEAYKIRLLDSDFYVKGQPASEFWPQNG